MELVEKQQDVGALTEGLGALCQRARRANTFRGLSRQLTALEAAHDQLARLEARLPNTSAATRFRRDCVESLQADMRELEVQVTKCEILESAVEDILARQLGATRRLLSAAPPFQSIYCRFDCAGIGPSLLLAAVILAWAAMIIGGRLFVGVFVGGFFIAVTSTLYGQLMRVKFEFDGRLLRITRCMFGVKHWFTRTVDLARFNRVVLTDFEVSYKDSAPTRRTRVELHTLAGGIELGSGPMNEGTVELGERLREWCAIAASEAQ